MIQSQFKTLWELPTAAKNMTRIHRYMRWLRRHYQLDFINYEELYQWSVEKPADFWQSIWQYFNVKSYSPYKQVLSDKVMPHARWFEGATLNYVEHIFSGRTDFSPAIKFLAEDAPLSTMSWDELESQVASMAAFLKANGVVKGDRVVGYLPNIPEAVVAFLAAASLGAIWSSASPDFGTASVIDRFAQIEPKILFAADGYRYGGKAFNRLGTIEEMVQQLPTLKQVVIIPFLDKKFEKYPKIVPFSYTIWQNALNTVTPTRDEANSIMEERNPDDIGKGGKLTYEPVDFAHPLYILFSSGTTGIPKAIVHGHGGILLEHSKYLAFHNDLNAGETFFWYSTTGWMMWNFAVSSLLLGGTLLIYDGSPAYPSLDFLWKLASNAGVNHFGTSAPYIVSCMKADFNAKAEKIKLNSLRSIGSTGSPLPDEAFSYIYKHIKKDVWLASISGGTDVCTAWVGGNILLPVVEGEIQCRCLGCAMESWDELGNPILNEVGEMVVTKPMPSMPVFFWHDEDFEKYNASYFEMYPNVWRHGDWLKITDRQSLIIYGRSDATLNRQGVRIGTAEIYRVLDTISELKDSLIVNLELKGGEHFMPLFVVCTEGVVLDDNLKSKIKKSLREAYSPRHVPDDIITVSDIPYTISGKKLEAPVKKILMGVPLSKAANLGSVRNPKALDLFVEFASKIASSH